MDANFPLLGALMPHPPLLIPDIGMAEIEQVLKTKQAMEQISREMMNENPDLLVIISPHGPMFEDTVVIMGGDRLKGHLQSFASAETFEFANEVHLAEEIVKQAKSGKIPIHLIDQRIKDEFSISMELDYGATVPLYFIKQAGYSGPILHVTPGLVHTRILYQAGKCIQSVLNRHSRKAVIIASGDNSHALLPNAPAGFREEGIQFDALLQKSMESSNWVPLLTQDEFFLQKAAEDTIPSLSILFGIYDQAKVKGHVLSYEGPFGVGYTVAKITPDGIEESLFPRIEKIYTQRLEKIRKSETPFVQLARQALEHYVLEQKVMAPPEPILEEMSHQAGCFVSLKMNGQLRGCIGTVDPVTPNIAAEIIRNAICAGTQDDRFFPVEAEDLDQLIYSVDILSKEETVHSLAELDPQRYGLIVVKGERSGLLLPNIEGVETADEQIQITKQKAGIGQDEEDVTYYKFEVMRYT
jgi:MEMO1 family protein